MTIHLSTQSNNRIQHLAQVLKIDEDNVLKLAIEALERELEFKQELNEWDFLSDEALQIFENNTQ